jgi:hypothetical protein
MPGKHEIEKLQEKSYTGKCVHTTEIKVKVKFTLEQAMKAQSWSRIIAVLFL